MYLFRRVGANGTMRAYIAARYDRREEVYAYSHELEALGIEIVSTWIDGHHEVRPDVERDATEEEIRSWAEEDLRDLRRADTLIFFSEPPGNGSKRGGRHVEMGFALAKGHRILVVGDPENVFHRLFEVRHYPTFDELMKRLRSERGIR